ncbi:hypothetical protein GCM10011512_25190 [Tersicoccus solisilvae]|uniref:Uncharacterized protein n=1 Tax=Tersicoccus solisilvae TaxID=1882339 RepID=A0ABQ1PHW0_9MICC|nr:hypothetical protein GCM10011512_25190 [Tersicoccus solisilvae]
MSESRDGRLLTGTYGTWRGERHALLGAVPDGGRLLLLRWGDVAMPPPWKSAQLPGQSSPRYRNKLSVESSEVSDVFTVQVDGSWNNCALVIDDEPDDLSWMVGFVNGRDAWAHHAQDQPGIDGDPYDSVGGTLPKADVESVVSHVQRFEDGKPVGNPEERWEYGPLA